MINFNNSKNTKENLIINSQKSPKKIIRNR